MELAGKKVLVVGLGRSGLAAARLCHARGARVTVTDARPAEALGELELPAGVARELGRHDLASFTGAELIVLSPGVPPLPQVEAARAAGVAITGELELAARFVEATLVAITGTNGKSTTTTLTGAILAETGRPTFVGGNLGVPLAEAVGTPAAGVNGLCVVEASSFQLETVERFRPRVGVLLNITADHLDRYPDLEAYGRAKTNVFAAQTAADFAVINADDDLVERLTRQVPARRLSLSTRHELREGGWIAGDSLCVRLPDGAVERYPATLPGLVGRHNQENALASLLAGRLAGATPAQALRALTAFRPLAHRMELVAETAGVAYFDDSKGTNVGAVVAALSGFPRPVVLIAGGRDKGGAYEPLAQAMKDVGRGVVVIGEAAERIATALAPVVPVARAATMEEAVVRAAALARAGDAVVLSPACSSFDMFRNYEHRAQVFRAAVESLASGARRSQGAT
jgi:UDP-N-acetylmuramoylalanine--D-glutamate ligase